MRGVTNAGSGRITLGDCVELLEAEYDPSWAEEWDAVGLCVGDPRAALRRVHFAVDPTPEVAAEAIALGAELLVTHHPLFLRGVHGVAETGVGGAVVAELIRGGCGLFTAHTNADVARPGVSDALADLLGVRDTVPVAPLASSAQPGEPLDKLVVFVPGPDRPALFKALAAAGAGSFGDYDRCGFWSAGTGTFRPLAGAHPAIGEVGGVSEVAEDRLEMVFARRLRLPVVAALRSAHPYEEPAFDVIELAPPVADPGQARGLGRVGELAEPVRLDIFVDQVMAALPSTAWGVRATGHGGDLIRRVAVCGGSGGELAGPAAALGADVLVTADARHHHTMDAVAAHGLAIVDAAHWATEQPWLAQAAARLRAALPATVGSLTTTVSELVTDPWRLHSC